MKKEYVSPATLVAIVELQQMIAESDVLGLGKYGGNTVLTRNHNHLWDDDDDDLLDLDL